MDTAVKELFNDSLDTMGLNYVKYSQLPLNLRGRTLSNDIFNEISNDIEQCNLSDEKFYEKEIYDFSENDLETHQKIVHACIALVCLGHNSYIKPLINYLDFPEIRWTIKIDYLLNTLINSRNGTFKVPTHAEKINWQNLFISKTFYSNLKDISNIILTDDKKQRFNYYEYSYKFNFSNDLAPLSSIDFSKKISDDLECAEYYYLNCYSRLKRKDYNNFITFIDDSIDDSKIPFINTIAKSVVDVFNDLDIDFNVNFWKNKLIDEKIGVLSSVFFYRIFNSFHSNKNLARDFVKIFLVDSLSFEKNNGFENIYKSTNKGESIINYCFFIKDYETYPRSVKLKITELDSICSYKVRDYVANIYSSEKESLVLFSQYHKPGSKQLYKSFKKRYNKNTEILGQLSILKDILSKYSEFYKKISILRDIRTGFESSYLSTKNVKENIKDEYVNLFHNWIQETTKEIHNVNDDNFIDLM
ncbi:hypothetical protein [Mucilaginibacter sp.]|uniref:hypothetical protein n=1 Tax=Mucilaginibacter sp. TaxID=1882438 RepID=UPI0032671835